MRTGNRFGAEPEEESVPTLGTRWLPSFVEKHIDEGVALEEKLSEAYSVLQSLVTDAQEQLDRRPVGQQYIERREDEDSAVRAVQEVDEWLQLPEIRVFRGGVQKNLKMWAKLLDDGGLVRTSWRTEQVPDKFDGLSFRFRKDGDPWHNCFDLTDEGMRALTKLREAAYGAIHVLGDEEQRQVMVGLLDLFGENIASIRNARDLLREAADARERGTERAYGAFAQKYASHIDKMTERKAWRRTVFSLDIAAFDKKQAEAMASDAAHSLATAAGARVEACMIDSEPHDREDGFEASIFSASVVLVAEDGKMMEADDVDLEGPVIIRGRPKTWTSEIRPGR